MKTITLQKTVLNSALVAALAFAGTATASLFDTGLPAGWDCVGTCGALGADGDVTAAPMGSSQYGYVATTNGVRGVGLPDLIGTTGSTLKSSLFSAQDGDELSFDFNFITSDGGDFSDYAWARLLNEMNEQVAILFTARTRPEGRVVPGFGMPEPESTLDPSVVTIAAGFSNWSPLGSDSGDCFVGVDNGCGSTGWVNSSYSIGAAGNYFLEFGVVNWRDTFFQSGLAFDGITVGGTLIDNPDQVAVPAPATLGLLGLGLLGLRLSRRQK